MPFIYRTTQTPPLNQIQQIEQVVIVDQTGPAIQLGVSTGATCLVGEFLKGPFMPTEVFSTGDIFSIYGGLSALLSQDKVDCATATQDGSGVGFEGNGLAHLKGRKFNRLVLERVDCDMTTTDGGSTKAYVQFDVDIGANETDSGVTSVDILIPAGTRFGDNSLSLATAVIATSQDIIIPKGSTITSTKITVTYNLEQDEDTAAFTLTETAADMESGATCFFVKGTSAAGTTAAIDTAIDTALPNVSALTKIASTGISTINSASASTDVYAAGTAMATLQAKIISLYTAAINKTLPSASPMDQITCIWAARNDVSGAAKGTIRGALWENAKASSTSSRGRTAVVSANPSASSSSSAASTCKTNAAALPFLFTGVDADRVSVNFPYTKIFSSELNKNILISPSGWKASLFSTLPEEWESGVDNDNMATIVSIEDAFIVNALAEADYVNFKAKGLSAIIRDRTLGYLFQSSIMAVNPTTYPTRTKDNRRRFADFVQDTLAQIAGPYLKKPGTNERVDALTGEVDSFLSSLKSPNNPSLQRIERYLLDSKSANTAQLTGVGIRTIIVKVRMLGDLDDIVFQTEIGPTVDITQTA